MTVLFVIILLAVVSVLLAINSLRNLHKIEEIKTAQEDLNKGKVIFHRDSVSSPSRSL